MSKPSQLEIFLTFLRIGAISFGGGVVAYLRDGLVRQKKWFDDVQFLELTSISNTLPGLNATNIAILAGDRLRGWVGAAGALVGMCLPAFLFMTAAGMVYADSGARPLANAALRGVAAAATGLVALLLGLVARGLRAGRRWTRTPALLTQLFTGIVAIYLLQAPRYDWGIPALVLALAGFAMLFAPASMQLLTPGRPDKPEPR